MPCYCDKKNILFLPNYKIALGISKFLWIYLSSKQSDCFSRNCGYNFTFFDSEAFKVWKSFQLVTTFLTPLMIKNLVEQNFELTVKTFCNYWIRKLFKWQFYLNFGPIFVTFKMPSNFLRLKERISKKLKKTL